MPQVTETADAVRRAMREAGIADASDVHFVQVKCPLLTAGRMHDAVERGHTVATEDTYESMGYRRVVPSPKPTKVLELNAIKTLVSAGHLVVAAGGGGIPVAEFGDGFYKGVEAVIDKDLTSALLARELGADLLLISTGVHQISINFKKPDQRALEQMTLAEARKYMAEGQFPPGSMGPKVEAAMRFLEGGSRGKVLITSPESVIDALDGKTGTWMMA
jgi:carbamate kinase